jgi:hypothetical protein
MAPDLETLRQRYRQEPNTALLAARALGRDSYTPEGWQAIEEEVQRRGLTYTVLLPIIDPFPKARDAATATSGFGLPGWLSLTLLLLAGIFLLLHSLVFLGYLGLAGPDNALTNADPTSPLILSLSAFGATRCVRDEPYTRPSRLLGITAIAFTLVSLGVALAKRLSS